MFVGVFRLQVFEKACQLLLSKSW